jgi:hypothetical protein
MGLRGSVGGLCEHGGEHGLRVAALFTGWAWGRYGLAVWLEAVR